MRGSVEDVELCTIRSFLSKCRRNRSLAPGTLNLFALVEDIPKSSNSSLSGLHDVRNGSCKPSLKKQVYSI